MYCFDGGGATLRAVLYNKGSFDSNLTLIMESRVECKEVYLFQLSKLVKPQAEITKSVESRNW